MTTTRAKTCASCAFPTDHMLHFRNCVPTSQWPRDLRERKAAAMGQEVIIDPDREPERTKPNGLAEYRRLHPEANPLTTENITVMESRKRVGGKPGEVDTWERVVGVREAMNKVGPCPRCNRPMLDRSMHITCQPVDGSVIPADESRNRLKRDTVTETRRHPVIHTTAEVRTGTAWYETLPEAEEPAADEEELQDFLGDPEPDAEMVDPDVMDRVIAEQEAGRQELVITNAVSTSIDSAGIAVTSHKCDFCDRTSPTRAGIVAHQRSHKADA